MREMVEKEGRGKFVIDFVADDFERGMTFARTGLADVGIVEFDGSAGAGAEGPLGLLYAAAPTLPVVVVGDSEEEELALRIVHEGAADYLERARLDGHLLVRALRYAIERGRSEQALEHERDLLNTLLENVPDRIYFKDRESRFIRINYSLTHLLGLSSAEQAYGKTDFDFYDAEHAKEARADEERLMTGGDPIFGKVEHEVLGNRRESWSLTTKLPMRNARGEIIGTCGISREITEIKQLEIALAAERNLLRGVMDNLPDAIFLKDRKGRYLLDNAAHWKGLGARGPEEVRGKTVFDFFPAELAEEFHRNDMHILETGEAQINHEEESLSVQGRRRWRLTTKVPWRDDEGKMLGVLCIARDITEQKEAAEKLRQANAELEKRREELLATLADLQSAHTQLRDMQLQIVEAEKMKTVGRLAAGVAHEVKNPLAVIRMGVEFLQSCPLDDTAEAVVDEISDAVNRADGVIRGLLDFSVPKQLELQPCDLNRLIENAVNLVRVEARASIEVVLEIERGLPPVPLDAAKISQVLINLLTNALHAMPGGGTVTVRTYTKQLTGVGANIGGSRNESFRVGQALVVVEIDDTGHGIPEDKLAKVFEPFFTTKPTGQGTGLGLSVVKTIIDLHGGTIDLCNLANGGTRVTLMFRL